MLSGAGMSVLREFREFAFKGNVVDLAVGVVIGTAFGKIVNAIVTDLFMPVVGAILPEGSWRTFTVTPLKIAVGDLLGAIVDFLCVAAVLFFVVVKVNSRLKVAPAKPATQTCPECLEAVPLAAKRCRACTSPLPGAASSVAAALLFLFLLAPTAASAAEPVFQFGQANVVEQARWTAQGKTGFLLSGGNARALSLSATTNIAREDKDNRFAFEGALAFVRTSVFVFTDTNGDGLIDPGEDGRLTQTASQAWSLKGRYDRFFTEANSAFAQARIASDVPAGKQLLSGGQLGWSRRLVNTDTNRTLVELGYDFSYERYVVATSAVAIHSARAYVSHALTLSDVSSLTGSVEVLSNLNRETAPNPNGTDTVAPLRDSRVNASLGLTAALMDNLKMGLTGTLRYDQNPAPRSNIQGAAFAPGYTPFADSVDGLVEASLLITFL